jgi:hypothetical protein
MLYRNRVLRKKYFSTLKYFYNKVQNIFFKYLANFEDSANFGQESQSHEFGHINQIGKGGKYGQNDGPDGNYGQNFKFGGFGQQPPPAPGVHQPGFNGDIRPYNADNFGKTKNLKKTIMPIIVEIKQHKINTLLEKNKLPKPNQFPPMIAGGNFKPQMQVIPISGFDDPLKGFMTPSFGSGGFPSFGGKGFSGTSFGSFGGLSGFGGIKNKLSMLLGSKFGGLGGGHGGGLLGGMLGWD